MQMLMKKNIITGAETWVYGYDVETKAQSSQWVSATSPTLQKKHGKFGPMWKWYCVFWLWGHNSSWISTSWLDCEQGMLSECDEEAERGSGEKKVWFVEGGKWLLHHDNALAHSSLLIYDFLKPWDNTLPPASILATVDFLLSIYLSVCLFVYWAYNSYLPIYWYFFLIPYNFN